eukprot:754490-Hanusia_phi.AAC.2
MSGAPSGPSTASRGYVDGVFYHEDGGGAVDHSVCSSTLRCCCHPSATPCQLSALTTPRRPPLGYEEPSVSPRRRSAALKLKFLLPCASNVKK